MKKFNYILILVGFYGYGQSVVSTINSGSLINVSGMVSIGEIFVNPINANQSNSGLIGILTQINEQTLEISQFEISESISVYPNPTTAQLFFKTSLNLVNEKLFIYNDVGQLVHQKQIDSSNSINLEKLSSGIYLIQFQNKAYKSFKIIKK